MLGGTRGFPELHTHTHTLQLTLSGPLVRLQHQVLLGLLQLPPQTLVPGSDLADPLLPLLHQPEPGAAERRLLTPTQKDIFFSYN